MITVIYHKIQRIRAYTYLTSVENIIFIYKYCVYVYIPLCLLNLSIQSLFLSYFFALVWLFRVFIIFMLEKFPPKKTNANSIGIGEHVAIVVKHQSKNYFSIEGIFLYLLCCIFSYMIHLIQITPLILTVFSTL